MQGSLQPFWGYDSFWQDLRRVSKLGITYAGQQLTLKNPIAHAHLPALEYYEYACTQDSS